jgi:hypothetical protein
VKFRTQLSEPIGSNRTWSCGDAEICQNDSEQNQRVVAGSNPAAPTTPSRVTHGVIGNLRPHLLRPAVEAFCEIALTL